MHVLLGQKYFVGLAARHAHAGEPGDLAAAIAFWDRVVHHHPFATGGHGKDEYFREPDHLANITEGRTAETCNVGFPEGEKAALTLDVRSPRAFTLLMRRRRPARMVSVGVNRKVAINVLSGAYGSDPDASRAR